MDRYEQTVTVTVQVPGEDGGVLTVAVIGQSDQSEPRVRSSPNRNKAALVDLAVWAGGEAAKQRLGLPSEWDQRYWFASAEGVGLAGHCGTAGCLAGRTVLVEGWEPVDWTPSQGDAIGYTLVAKGGVTKEVSDAARDLLGLDEDDADRLFGEDNDFDAVMEIIGELLAD